MARAAASVLASSLAPRSWNAHERLYCYVGAALASFLLTAVPNWTGLETMSGLPLAAFAIAWALAGVGHATAGGWLPDWVTWIDTLFLLCLAGFLASALIRGAKLAKSGRPRHSVGFYCRRCHRPPRYDRRRWAWRRVRFDPRPRCGRDAGPGSRRAHRACFHGETVESAR